MTFISILALTASALGSTTGLGCQGHDSNRPGRSARRLGGFVGKNGRPWAARGFTLVEMLVAVAVLAILVVMLATMMSDASLTVRNSTKHLTADDQARLVLDRLQMDFARMLKRNDVYFQFTSQANQQPGHDLLTIYSETPGFLTSGSTLTQQSNLSVVSYRINSSYQLQRLDAGCQWSDISFSPTAIPAIITTDEGTADQPNSDYHVLSNSVFRMQVAFLEHVTDTPPTIQITSTPPTPGSQAFQNLKAFIVSIAVLDPNSQELISSNASGAYTGLINALQEYSGSQNIILNPGAPPAPVAGTIDPIVSGWDTAINASTFAQIPNVPKAVAQQVRIYQRIIYLQ